MSENKDINDHIIELIQQRSIAFDEAKEYRLKAEALEQDNKKMETALLEIIELLKNTHDEACECCDSKFCVEKYCKKVINKIKRIIK